MAGGMSELTLPPAIIFAENNVVAGLVRVQKPVPNSHEFGYA
jgi:hypothetical protein